MGLATVHDIVTGMDGTIDVESAPGKGTIFTVSLPAVTAAVQAEPEMPPPVDMTVEGYVVIVDDEPLVREASARALAGAGIEMRAVADAARALAIIEELGDRVAILVTDVVMPDVGGRELAIRARQLTPGLPVLYITGYTDDAVLRRGVETERVELLRKPYSPQLLIEVIRRTIAKATRQRR